MKLYKSKQLKKIHLFQNISSDTGLCEEKPNALGFCFSIFKFLTKKFGTLY